MTANKDTSVEELMAWHLKNIEEERQRELAEHADLRTNQQGSVLHFSYFRKFRGQDVYLARFYELPLALPKI